MKTQTSLLLIGTALALSLFGAPAAQGQAPGWSRGQQNLAISYDECMRRAPAALQAEGYRRDDNPGGNFAVGIKGVHTAVIICSPAPNAKMLVHIVVSSNGEGGGTERERLQAQMERPGQVGPGSCRAPDIFNTTFEWIDNGRSLGTIKFFRDGRAQQTWLTTVPVTWQRDTNGDLIIYTDGTRWVTRLGFDRANCVFSGRRDRTSQTQDNVETVLRPVR